MVCQFFQLKGRKSNLTEYVTGRHFRDHLGQRSSNSTVHMSDLGNGSEKQVLIQQF